MSSPDVINITAVLKKLYTDAEFTVDGNTYEGLSWTSTTITKPTLAEIEAAWPEVQAEIKLAPIRAERDLRLDEIDLKYCNAEKWSSMTTAEKNAWKAHKQVLRDLPANIDPDNPVWPSMPTE